MSVGAAMDRGDYRRWIACAAVVAGLHAAGGAALALWSDPLVGGEPPAAMVVNLAALMVSPSVEDIAPGPVEQKVEPAPEPLQPEEKIEAKLEPPPPDIVPEVVLPPQEPPKPEPPKVEPLKVEPRKVERPKPKPTPPAPATTAPQRQQRVAALPTAPRSGAPSENKAAAASWHSQILAQIQRHKRYPEDARSRGEKGGVVLSFTLNRQGRVVASRVVRGSGFASLDQAGLATVRSAQPFPPPPADVPGGSFPFTVPLNFSIR